MLIGKNKIKTSIEKNNLLNGKQNYTLSQPTIIISLLHIALLLNLNCLFNIKTKITNWNYSIITYQILNQKHDSQTTNMYSIKIDHIRYEFNEYFVEPATRFVHDDDDD